MKNPKVTHVCLVETVYSLFLYMLIVSKKDFEKTFFFFTVSISNLIFVSDFSSVFILIVFLLLFPSEIPPQLQILTNKEYFQFILQNSFHQLFS